MINVTSMSWQWTKSWIVVGNHSFVLPSGDSFVSNSNSEYLNTDIQPFTECFSKNGKIIVKKWYISLNYGHMDNQFSTYSSI